MTHFYAPAPIAGALSDDARLTLSVAYVGPNLRTERPRKTKIGTEVAHVTRDLGHHFQGQKVNLQGAGGILWRPPTQCTAATECSHLSYAQMYTEAIAAAWTCNKRPEVFHNICNQQR